MRFSQSEVVLHLDAAEKSREQDWECFLERLVNTGPKKEGNMGKGRMLVTNIFS